MFEILEGFASVPDNHCMVLRDADDCACGVVLISAFQKACYREWGECLILDWTHSTNNLGFLLGELMATGPHGKGVPVCHMLVADQSKETMAACLNFFKESVGEMDPDTFVIDKDFTEWSVLNDVYPNSKVRFVALAHCQHYTTL